MKAHEVYLRFKSDNDNFHHFSIEELLIVGNPIDEDAIDMESCDDNLYVIDGKNGYKILIDQ